MLLWFVLGALAVLVGWVMRVDGKYASIPGPKGFPLVNQVPSIAYCIAHNGYLDWLLVLCEKYGQTFQIRLFGTNRLVFITELADLKHFFLSPNYEKGLVSHGILEDIFGDGIFNSDGEKWKVQRQTASSLFHFNNLQAFVPIFDDRAKVMASILREESLFGKPVDLQELFRKYTLDSIGELGFGVQIDSLKGNKDALKFAKSFDYVQSESSLRFAFHPLWKLMPGGTFRRHIQNVDTFMAKIVVDRRREMEKGVDFSDHTDLLSKFMLSKDADGKPMFDDKYLLDVIKNFLIAGRDTTAVCLTWTFFLLATHPEVEQKLLNEIETVIGGNITYEKLSGLKYMRYVLDESLRLYPPVPLDLRTTIQEDVLPSGHVLPAGTSTVYPAYIIHRLPQYWSNPSAFNPDRWETDTIKPFQFVAFHGGPRICLGQNMAYEEMKVALCVLLPLFKFTVVDLKSVQYFVSLTLPAKDGVCVNVTPRKEDEKRRN